MLDVMIPPLCHLKFSKHLWDLMFWRQLRIKLSVILGVIKQSKISQKWRQKARGSESWKVWRKESINLPRVVELESKLA